MRTILVILLVLITSCKSVYYVGMTESEFRDKNSGAKIVEMSEERTVYRLWTNSGIMFYYFKDGKMYKADMGKKNPDVVVDIK